MIKVIGRLWQPPVKEADDLLLLTGVNNGNINLLLDNGHTSFKHIAHLQVGELSEIKGFGKKSAEVIIESAKEKVAQRGDRD